MREEPALSRGEVSLVRSAQVAEDSHGPYRPGFDACRVGTLPPWCSEPLGRTLSGSPCRSIGRHRIWGRCRQTVTQRRGVDEHPRYDRQAGTIDSRSARDVVGGCCADRIHPRGLWLQSVREQRRQADPCTRRPQPRDTGLDVHQQRWNVDRQRDRGQLPVSSQAVPRRRPILKRVAATLAVVGAAAALELFVSAGSFDGSHDPFTQSVTARP